MHTLAWLRKDSAGAKLKKEWATDEPLNMQEGGTVERMTGERLERAAEALRNGGKVSGLVCLSSIASTFSLAGIRFQEQRLEAAGRQFWSTMRGASANLPPSIVGADTFWEEDDLLFPYAWPEKLCLPVLVRDPQRMPTAWQFLAMDEVVVSFWKIVDFTDRKIQRMQIRLNDMGEAEDDEKITLNHKIKVYRDALVQARRLARNVVISVNYADSNSAAKDLALSLREDAESVREHCGLSGWNKIAVIGTRRDDLRLAGLECGPKEVSIALAKVKWGPGRIVTESRREGHRDLESCIRRPRCHRRDLGCASSLWTRQPL